jgi:hypothetical protein
MLKHFELLSVPTNLGTDPTAIANFKSMFDAIVAGDPIMVIAQASNNYDFVYPAPVSGDDTTSRDTFIQDWLTEWLGSSNNLATDYAATVDVNGTQYYMYPTGPITTRSDGTTRAVFLLVAKD